MPIRNGYLLKLCIRTRHCFRLCPDLGANVHIDGLVEPVELCLKSFTQFLVNQARQAINAPAVFVVSHNLVKLRYRRLHLPTVQTVRVSRHHLLNATIRLWCPFSHSVHYSHNMCDM